jgi:hypothetical protein
VTRHLIELDKLLEDCLEAIDSRGWTVDECLMHYSEHRESLEPLLRSAIMTRLLHGVEPSPAFRAQALTRLQARLENSRRPETAAARSQNPA